ncbi:hypothetical protein PHYSODRAFT_324438 [Phytophthora sojae]|uniref:Uncharacterized protein n=1 Tax=Phytophthora sojae (strain P6497) TaxID=1094619 RepID=G4YWN0_PHYSP|nr:hypothetical protein PHYSODRAFT_324438 [Phytophthora sojae]EGZ23211.1 hypothetical protein PHYSODRAFT_324438 [Phytophthora sojae]|eukprot:XP_009518499.1 hypothetical protein PHYSODRAFT_324438 [Phytophthora sojae]
MPRLHSRTACKPGWEPVAYKYHRGILCDSELAHLNRRVHGQVSAHGAFNHAGCGKADEAGDEDENQEQNAAAQSSKSPPNEVEHMLL